MSTSGYHIYRHILISTFNFFFFFRILFCQYNATWISCILVFCFLFNSYVTTGCILILSVDALWFLTKFFVSFGFTLDFPKDSYSFDSSPNKSLILSGGLLLPLFRFSSFSILAPAEITCFLFIYYLLTKVFTSLFFFLKFSVLRYFPVLFFFTYLCRVKLFAVSFC